MEVEEETTSNHLKDSIAVETTTVTNESLIENITSADKESEKEISKLISKSNTQEEEDSSVSVPKLEDSEAFVVVAVGEKQEDGKGEEVIVHYRNSESVVALSAGIGNSVVVESMNVLEYSKDGDDGAVKEISTSCDDVAELLLFLSHSFPKNEGGLNAQLEDVEQGMSGSDVRNDGGGDVELENSGNVQGDETMTEERVVAGVVAAVVKEDGMAADEMEAVGVREDLKEEALMANEETVDAVAENDEEENMVEDEEKSLDTEMETEEEATLAAPTKTIEEDVCFICFDGGDLVLCDRRNCPKAYHPSCVNRDEAFFHSKRCWNCVIMADLQILGNNYRLDFEDMESGYPVILEILKGHSLKYALAATRDVPIYYLKQFWSTLNVVTVDEGADYLTAQLDTISVQITKANLRNILKLPASDAVQGKDDYDDFESEDQICTDILSLGYKAALNNSSHFKRMHLPPQWYALFSIVNRCLTSKHTGLDRCNFNVLRMFHGIAFNKHYDFADLIWDEFLELISDKGSSRARKFVPYMRFLKLIIRRLMRVYKEVNQRPNDDVRQDFKMKYLRLPNADDFPVSLPIPDFLLNYADPTAKCIIEIRTARASTAPPEPVGPTPEAHLRIEGSGEGTSEPREKDNARGGEGERTTIDDDSDASSSDSETDDDDDDDDDDDEGDEEDRNERQTKNRNDVRAQPVVCRVSTSTIQTHVLSTDIEKDAMDPVAQLHDPPSHSVVFQQTTVSSYHGDLAHTLSSPHLENIDIESGDTPLQSPPSFHEHMSREPDTLIRTHISTSATASLRDLAGTTVVGTTASTLQGPVGSPVEAITMPTSSAGHTVESTVVLTEILSGSGVSLPAPSTRLDKGKGIAYFPSPPRRPPPVYADLSVDELKSLLLAKLLSEASHLDQTEVDLVGILRRQADQASEVATVAHVNEFKESISQLFNTMISGFASLSATMENALKGLSDRIQVLEQICKAQADSRKRSHDDQDDLDHHEGEIKRQKTTTAGDIEVIELTEEKDAGETQNVATTEKAGAQSSQMVMHTGPMVEKPEGSSIGIAGEVEIVQDLLVDVIDINSDPEESENALLKIKEEVHEMISFSDDESGEGYEEL